MSKVSKNTPPDEVDCEPRNNRTGDRPTSTARSDQGAPRGDHSIQLIEDKGGVN